MKIIFTCFCFVNVLNFLVALQNCALGLEKVENVSENGLIVDLPAQGRIRGHILRTNTNKKFFAFHEIPYAGKPLGKLRFMDPVEPERWEGILNTTKNTKFCLQWMQKVDGATEDCLYLNVYTPVRPGNNNQLPVLMFIHGGNYMKGSGIHKNFGPEFLINHNIIVVTINYRLGPFGFLSTQDDVILGNQGLKDQNFALKWINKNIHLFGGDPKKITISGQSAGAFSVGYQILSSKSKGLFQGAIMQSGSVLSATAYQRRARDMAFKLCYLANESCNKSMSSHELLNFLQEVDAEKLNMINLPQESGLQLNKGYTFSPTIEIDHHDAFITKKQYVSLEQGDFNRIPIMIGVNSEERIMEAKNLTEFKELMSKYDANLWLTVNEDFNILSGNRLIFAEKIRQIYTPDKYQNDLGAAIRFKSDSRYTHCTISHAQLQSAYTKVFFYQFSYYGSFNSYNITLEGAGKVGHGDELNYLWRKSINSNLKDSPESDKKIVDQLSLMWTNFVKYLNPTPEKVDLLENLTWPLMTQKNMVYLDIGDRLSIKKNPKEYHKWMKLINQYGNPPFDSF